MATKGAKRLAPETKTPAPKSQKFCPTFDDKEFAADSVIHFTKKAAGTAYIHERCEALHGSKVVDVLKCFTYKDANSTERVYSLADLRYDMKCGRLEVKRKAPSKKTQNKMASEQRAPVSERKEKNSVKKCDANHAQEATERQSPRKERSMARCKALVTEPLNVQLPDSQTQVLPRKKRSPVQQPAPETKCTEELDPDIATIIRFVNSAVDLPDACKQMLTHMIPVSFGAEAAVRHPVQSLAVCMVGELVSETEAKLQEAFNKEQVAVDDFQTTKANLQQQSEEAEATLTAAADVKGERDAVFSRAAEAWKEKQEGLVAAEEAMASAHAAQEATKADKISFEAVLENNLTPLRSEDMEASQAQVHLEKLRPLIRKVVHDESLHTALPTACLSTRSKRGAFDTLLLDELNSSLVTHIGGLTDKMQTDIVAVEESIRIAAEAERALEVAALTHQAAKTEVDKADAAVNDAVASKSAKTAELTAFTLTLEKAIAAGKQKASDLKQFQSVDVAAFVQLRDKSLKADDVMEATDEVEATRAVEADDEMGGKDGMERKDVVVDVQAIYPAAAEFIAKNEMINGQAMISPVIIAVLGKQELRLDPVTATHAGCGGA